MGEVMGWLGARRRWTVICAVGVGAVVGLPACSDDSTKVASCTGDESSGVTVAGDDPPQWATSWVSQAGGAMGGGAIDVPTAESTADDVLEAVYACTGLKNDTVIELAAVRGVAAERQVRVGVQDYAYRAGEMTVGQHGRAHAGHGVVQQSGPSRGVYSLRQRLHLHGDGEDGLIQRGQRDEGLPLAAPPGACGVEGVAGPAVGIHVQRVRM